MYRYFNLDIESLGIIFVICGVVCIILALTRKAYAPLLSFICGILLLLCGGLMWLSSRLSILQWCLGHFGTLAGGIAFASIDLVNYYKRLKCTVPWQGEFLDISTYGVRKKGLSYGAAVFSYQVDGISYQQSSLDKRSWLTFLKSPFLKKFTVGDRYDIYLNPNNPRNFALSRRPHFDLFSFFGWILLAFFFLS